MLPLYDLSRHGVGDEENGFIDGINSYADNRVMLHIGHDHALRLETNDHVDSVGEPAGAFRYHPQGKR